MKTSTAEKNYGKCPKCGDELTKDKAGRGFVRHKTNKDCKYENTKKDN